MNLTHVFLEISSCELKILNIDHLYKIFNIVSANLNKVLTKTQKVPLPQLLALFYFFI